MNIRFSVHLIIVQKIIRAKHHPEKNDAGVVWPFILRMFLGMLFAMSSEAANNSDNDNVELQTSWSFCASRSISRVKVTLMLND